VEVRLRRQHHFRSSAASAAPANWTSQYHRASAPAIRFVTEAERHGGLKWPPVMWPTAETITAITSRSRRQRRRCCRRSPPAADEDQSERATNSPHRGVGSHGQHQGDSIRRARDGIEASVGSDNEPDLPARLPSPVLDDVERVALAAAYKESRSMVDVDPDDRACSSEVSGQRLVPVLEVDGQVTDSPVILRWLERITLTRRSGRYRSADGPRRISLSTGSTAPGSGRRTSSRKSSRRPSRPARVERPGLRSPGYMVCSRASSEGRDYCWRVSSPI